MSTRNSKYRVIVQKIADAIVDADSLQREHNGMTLRVKTGVAPIPP
jgi:hypothetical protein